MDTPHRRILRVVRLSEESTTCELPVSDGACGSCRGCSSFLSANGGLVARAGRDGEATKSPADLPPKSLIKIELPTGLFAVSGTHRAGRPDGETESVRVGDSIAIEAPGSLLLALSSVFYLAPAILMLFFAVSCSFLYPDSEALVALAAACGLGLGLGAILFFGPALRLLVTKQLIVRSDI